jgi:hypothetical protein
MNYFAHAIPFLDDPYFAAGTGVPDWLTVADRECRVRLKHAEPFVDDPDATMAAVARGLIQHIRDDMQFHGTAAFIEVSLELSAKCGRYLDGETGLRPAFLGHLLVEVLLDAGLIAADRARLEAYYRTLEAVDPELIQESVNRIARRPTQRLSAMITGFCRHRILWDYLEDAKLMVRLNQVMRRLGMAQLPEGFVDLLPDARRSVDRRQVELLEGIPTRTSY